MIGLQITVHNVVNFLRSKMVRLDGRIWDYIVNNTRKSAIADKPREENAMQCANAMA